MRTVRLLSLLGGVPLGYAVLFFPSPNNESIPAWYYYIFAAIISVGILQIILPQLTLANVNSQRIVYVLGAITTIICCLMLGLILLLAFIGSGNW